MTTDEGLPAPIPLPDLNVRQHGAVGDGVTDDTEAIQSALLGAQQAGRGCVRVPAGRYRLTDQLRVSRCDVALVGDGRGISELVWDHAGGLSFDFDRYNQRLTVSGLSLLAATPRAGVALRAAWPTPPTAHDAMQEPHITDVHIGPVDEHAHYWDKGVEITNGRGLKLSRFYIHGMSDTVGMTHGVHLLGSTVIVSITSGAVYSAREGIVAEEEAEGIYVSHVEVVYAETGFRFAGAAGSSITGCHTNTSGCGIKIVGHNDMAIVGNLLYRLGDGGYSGIRLEDSPFCTVAHNNIARTMDGGYRNGILLVGASHGCTITGNILRGMDSGIWLAGGGSDKCIVSGNRGVDCWRVVTDHGRGNVAAGNL